MDPYFTGFPVHIVAIHMLPGMLVVGISIWLVVNGFERCARREKGGAWRLVSGLVVLLVFLVCLVATLWYYRDCGRPEIYPETLRFGSPAAEHPPDSQP